ncbi:hypothetical protein ELZ88_24135 (plasmid) [Salmonella enterica subsp. enterica serovar Karamoja]|uniref:Uncharacterized protein n=1 Tax=Salmonella enterica subsp. enterica serovar Karamoja TaxID=2500153 RepID=A0A3Q9MPI5_SALET|nr:hypothetical protein [Salmonella enterica]AZT39637.1 hypothetical protein ELZ88_24135 [Salmonella enterica subsp. enterica serovar Karamoja]AZT44469.1 hypothetical protein EL007_24810 [Salmonella enterica subsp. enterica serovar Karamoja]
MRSLSGVLMAARGRRLLSQNGWQVDNDSAKDGFGMAEYRLLPAALQRRIAGLELDSAAKQRCLAQSAEGRVSALISLRHYGAKLRLQHAVQPVSACWRDVQMALQTQLASLDEALLADLDTLALHSGGRYEGAVVFRRQTANLTVTALPDDALPAGYRLSDADVAQWLDAILNHGADVLSLRLMAELSTYSLQLAACDVEPVCIVPAGVPVRRWFPRQAMASLTLQARHVVDVLTSSLGSFR